MGKKTTFTRRLHLALDLEIHTDTQNVSISKDVTFVLFFFVCVWFSLFVWLGFLRFS